jgi:hypothetical protein
MCWSYRALPEGQKGLNSHVSTYWRSWTLLDSSNLDLLIDLKNDLGLTRVRCECYCLEAASFLLLVMRKRLEDEKRRQSIKKSAVVVNEI